MQRNLIFLLYVPARFMSGFQFISSAGLILFNLISLVCLVCLRCLVCPRSISFSVLALLVHLRPSRCLFSSSNDSTFLHFSREHDKNSYGDNSIVYNEVRRYLRAQGYEGNQYDGDNKL